MICAICNNVISLRDKLIVKEMMFGNREQFEYYQCKNCEALQIKSVPKDIYKYYQKYYTENKGYTYINKVRKKLWRVRSHLSLTMLYPLIKFLSYNTILHWAHCSNVDKESKILDVGCGNGDILFEFSKHGFKNLFGIDPFLQNLNLFNIILRKVDLLSFNPVSKFDLIMFNHSLEHIYEHHATLKKALELLNANGTIMIRTPIINKAFELYKENWVQIDAPRHFIIHSIKSMKILCETNKALLYSYYFDSSAFQFLGSEQFKNDIPSNAKNSYKNDLKKSIFTNDDIKKYNLMAKQFNKAGLGDQAVFFVKKL